MLNNTNTQHTNKQNDTLQKILYIALLNAIFNIPKYLFFSSLSYYTNNNKKYIVWKTK